MNNHKILILIGIEGPELINETTKQVVWRPKGTDPHFRAIVKQALVQFMLKNAQDEWKWDLASADIAVFRNGEEFLRQLRKGKYDRAVVYAHGDDNALMPEIDKWSTHVREYTLAKGFSEAGVRQALLLGCYSKTLAERVARISEGYVRVGGIDYLRQDSTDNRHSHIDILNMIIWGYGQADER